MEIVKAEQVERRGHLLVFGVSDVRQLTEYRERKERLGGGACVSAKRPLHAAFADDELRLLWQV